MTDPTAPVDAPTVSAPVDSPMGASLVDGTATAPALPTAEEMQALIAQVQAMQAELSAARGMPTDPVGAAAHNLKEHVTARHASGLTEFAELKAAVDKLGDTVDSKTSDLLRTIAASLRDAVEGAVYVKALANELHKSVLTNA